MSTVQLTHMTTKRKLWKRNERVNIPHLCFFCIQEIYEQIKEKN